jgi:ABC-type uncharacterized transport system permease subunit
MRILLYVITAALYLGFAFRGSRHLLLIPLVLHAALLFQSINTPAGLDLGLANSLSVVGWTTALMFWLSAYPLRGLRRGVAIAGALCSLAPLALPHPAPIGHSEFLAFKAHLVVAALAYSLFAVAALQVLVMTLIERRLHGHELAGGLHGLPPLLSMERFLFQIIGAAFILLTLTLASGMIFAEEIFGKPLAFTHKIVFAIVSWIIFGLLLIGRAAYGWRGKTAQRWVLAGFAALLLAYLGTKFVIEVLSPSPL